MSVLYCFVQADNERDAQNLIDYLVERDLLPISDFTPGRNPTYSELRHAFDQLSDYKVEYHVTAQEWYVAFETGEGIQAALWSIDWDQHGVGNENSRARFYWQGGVEGILPVAQKLAPVCGVITIVSGIHPDNFTFVLPDQAT